VIDESYRAVGGLGPEVSRFVRGSTRLAIDSRAHLDDLTRLIDGAAPVLDSQADTADAVTGWASHLATVTSQLRDHDGDLRGILQNGPQAASEAQALFDRLQPTLPIVLANLVSLGDVAVTYNASIEQILVLLPQGAQEMQAINTANRNSKQAYKGGFLDFNLNLNLPPPCTTGFLPIQQQRAPTFEDYPDRPAGDVYCRVPQDSMFNVRGARNTPCITRPGKRAPTVAMCESDEQYEPLNEGYNWKGDPNATMSGQPIPQLPPGAAPVAAPTQAAPPPIAVAEYDPGTGNYIGPDGKVYTQTDLAQQQQEKTWQTMLLPPTNP
jgi:phospholipid/cholesterol/gamma-HCH transport system substrate-binding protein